MVFIKGQYERALVSLYRNLAEIPEKRFEIKEAIGLVKEIAQRRGVNVNENNAKAIYRQEITAEILDAGSRYFGIGKYNGQCQTLIDYYINPTESNFTRVVNTAKNLASKGDNSLLLFNEVVTILSANLRDRISSRI